MEYGLRKLLEELTVGLSKHYVASSEFMLREEGAEGSKLLVSVGPGGKAWRANEAEQLGFCIERGREEDAGNFGRLMQASDGRALKVSVLRLGGIDETPSWTLTICSDITHLWKAQELLDQTTRNGEDENKDPRDIKSILYNMIQDSIAYVGASPERMTRDQKVKGIGYLNQRGAFRIMNAGPIIAKFYNVSKYTVYNYINLGERTAKAVACELD